MKKGIALCGGGGKGAYQIGILKYLSEKGDLAAYSGFSGTSVGALNAVLYALGRYDLAEQIWTNYVHSHSLLKFDPSTGHLSREGLSVIIDSIDLSPLKNKNPVYVHVNNVKTHKTESILLNRLPTAKMKQYLLASSALPVVYPRETISGIRYQDGGTPFPRQAPLGNCPVEPLCQNGFTDILILALESSFSIYDVNKVNLTKQFPDVNFQPLYPSIPPGNLIKGTLNFSRDQIDKLIALGYEDAATLFSEVHDMATSDNLQIVHYAKETLRSASDFEAFVEIYNWSDPYVKFPTLGGNVCWNTIYECDNWKIQMNKTNPLQNHYRILDPENKRRGTAFGSSRLIAELIQKKDRDQSSRSYI